MRTTNELLDAVKARHQIGSDYRLAQVLQCQKSAISGYRAGRSRLDESMCLKVAELLQEPAGAILAEVAAERAKRPDIKKAWQRAAAALATAATVLIFMGFLPVAGIDQVTISQAKATDQLLIMREMAAILALWLAGMALASRPSRSVNPDPRF